MLTIPLLLLWRSTSKAAVPLTLLYGGASVALTAMLAGQHSPWMTRAAVGALILAPASVTHLALTFPRERPILADLPGLARTPYITAGALVPVGWLALERGPLLGPTFLSLLLALAAGAWLVLLFSCWLALRESESSIERARARLVFFGALLGPLIPTFVIAPNAIGTARIGVLYLWSAAALMPLPIALAISRYNLFDLGWDVRHAVVRIIYMGISALAVSLVFGLAMRFGRSPATLLDAGPLYLISFICVAAIEALRSRTPGLLEVVMAPKLHHLRSTRQELESDLSTLQDEDATSKRLGDAIRDGVGAKTGCVFLSTFGEWRPAYPFGRPSASWSDLLAEALAVLGNDSVLQLPAHPEREARAELLRAARIEAIASIDGPGARYGVVLVGGARRAPYTGVEIDFIRAVTTQAAVALHNAHLTSQLVAAERQATTGRLALALAHDLGKDLGWIRRLARRLPERFADERRLARDALMIADLSDSLSDAVDRFVRDSTQQVPNEELETLDRLIDRAVRRVSRAHGSGRVTLNVDPRLRTMAFHEHLERVLGNLLDNALHATAGGATVHVFGTLEEDVVQITVEDRGPGIPSAMANRVFEAGVSSRLDRGGSGVGLTVAREIVEVLGGTIRLDPGSECGTRVSLRLPARKETDDPAE
jgi:signal transduction histidine kinase